MDDQAGITATILLLVLAPTVLDKPPGGRRNLLKILIAIGVGVLALFAIWKYRNKG